MTRSAVCYRAGYRWRVVRMLGLACVLLGGLHDAAARSAKSAGQSARAAKLSADGAKALAAHSLADAARLLGESYRLAKESATLYQLGALAMAEGRSIEAQDLMRRFLAESGGDGATETPEIKEARRVVQLPHTGACEVSVFGDRGALVIIDERPVGVLPLPLPLLLPSGKHSVVLELKKKQTRGKVSVPKGRVAEMRVNRETGAVLVKLLPGVLFLPEWSGVPDAERAQLLRSIEQTMRIENAAPLSKEVALEQAPELASCLATAECQGKLAAGSSLDLALVVRISMQAAGASANWQLSLSIIDAEVADVAATVQRSCDGCDVAKVAAELSTALPALLAQGSGRPRGTLEVKSPTPGVEVFLDGQKRGLAPYKRAAWVGPRTVSLQRQGYTTVEKQLVVEADKTATFESPLEEALVEPPPAPLLPPPPPPPQPVKRLVRSVVVDPRPRWRIGLGIAAIAGASTMIGFGAVGLARDGSCAVEASSPIGDCRRFFDTTPVGSTLIGTGSALLVGGIVLIAVPGRKRIVETYVTDPPEGVRK